MRQLRSRILRWTLATAALAFLAAGAGFAWLVTTQAGLARAVAFLESLDAVEIRVSGASGRLIGPLRAASVDIRHPRAVVRIEELSLDYEPSGLLAVRVSAERIRAASVSVRLSPRAGPPKPAAFLPRWLTVVADDASIGRLSIETAEGATLVLASVAGSASVTRSRIDFSALRGDAGAWSVSAANGRLRATEPLAIEAGVAWTLAPSREISGTARMRGDLTRLRVAADVASPGRGRAELELHDLAAGLRWNGRLAVQGIDLRRWMDAPPFGPLAAALNASGSARHYAAHGTVHGTGLPPGGVAIDGAAAYADGRVNIAELRMRSGDAAAVHWRGTVTTGEPAAFELQAAWRNFTWPLAGAARLRSSRGSLRAAGWREFEFGLEGEFDPLLAPLVAGRARGRFTTGEIVVEQSVWQALGGRVEVSGSLGRDERRTWTLSGRATSVDPAMLRPGLDGRLNFAFAASGAGLQSSAAWSATVSALSGSFREQPVAGGGTVRRAPGRTQFDRVTLSLGRASLGLEGTLGADAVLDARLSAPDLSRSLPGFAGRVDATFRLRSDRASLTFTGHDLAWRDHRAVVFSADAQVDLADRETSWLRLRTNGLTVAGQSLTDTRLSLDGLVRDHALALRIGRGEDAIELRGHGAWDGTRFRLDLASIAAEGPGAPPWRLESPTALEVSAAGGQLAPACFVYGPRRACVEGRWSRDGDWTLRAGTRAFPLEALDLRVPGTPRYRGLLSAEAQAVRRAGQPWNGELRGGIEDAVLEYRSASGQPRSVALGRTSFTIRSSAERHRLELGVTDAADTELSADLAATRVAGRPLAELPITGTIVGATRQMQLLPLLFPDIDQASGRLALRVSLAGSVGEPALTGEARLEQGSLDFYQTNLRLRAIEARLRLLDAALELEATAQAGEGALAVDGRLGWRDRRASGSLSLRGERLLLVDVPEARVLAAPDLRFTLDGRRIGVTGTVSIPEARIAPAETAGAVLPSVDERILRPETDDGASGRFEVEGDVRLVLGERVQLDAFGLSGRITGSVRTQSRPQQAAVASGELEIADGSYRAYTRELDVERGRLLFTGGPVTDPGVDLRASRKLPGHVVGVIVRGRLRRPQLTLYSEPALPQAQIASLLIVGQSLDRLQGEDRDSLASGRASLAAQGGALLAGQLGRYVGLDEVGLAQDADDSTALVLGKFLSPRLYLSYGVSLVDEINTFKLRYTIGDRWVISAESGRESSADVEYRVER
ncbi:MAG TPA: translocation/assembly module TamB domain-containing protein [Steroidobacteraceae bacterium]|nr:translocation/assembly module TamB domain-containing protein [Steroidobacteraceae bacterium]